jgi:predicted nucleotidyltransferase
MLDPRIYSGFTNFDLSAPGRVLSAGYFGSTSHNTYVPPTNPDSIDDVDVFIIALPPPENIIGLYSWEHGRVKQDELDVVIYSLQKFVGLLLKANPNVLGHLWLRDEDYLTRTPEFDRLIAERDIFSSLRAAKTFAGYAQSQFKKMTSGAFQGYMGDKRKQLVETYGFDCKNSSHLLRLLVMGTEFLETGRMNVYRTKDAQFFRDVKTGKYNLREVKDMAESFFYAFRDAESKSVLPKEPDERRAEQLLMEIVHDYLFQWWTKI